jgi:predicted lipoprotein with Yx(FWY)xxD motif
MIRNLWLPFAAAFTLSFGVAQAQSPAPLPPGVKVVKSPTASMLTAPNGLTLYVYDADTTPGKSACNGPCATNWPPLTATADAKPVGAFTVIVRDDGTPQWAAAGKPLYEFKNDKAPGDTNGNGVGGKWHVAQPPQ